MFRSVYVPWFMAFFILSGLVSIEAAPNFVESIRGYFFDTAETVVQKTLTPIAHKQVKLFFDDLWICFHDPDVSFEDVVNKHAKYMDAEKKKRWLKNAQRLDFLKNTFPTMWGMLIVGSHGTVGFINVMKKMALTKEEQEIFDEKIKEIYENKTRDIASDIVTLKKPENYELFKKYAGWAVGLVVAVGIGLVAYMVPKDK